MRQIMQEVNHVPKFFNGVGMMSEAMDFHID
jgi:hypothetical protein